MHNHCPLPHCSHLVPGVRPRALHQDLRCHPRCMHTSSIHCGDLRARLPCCGCRLRSGEDMSSSAEPHQRHSSCEPSRLPHHTTRTHGSERERGGENTQARASRATKARGHGVYCADGTVAAQRCCRGHAPPHSNRSPPSHRWYSLRLRAPGAIWRWTACAEARRRARHVAHGTSRTARCARQVAHGTSTRLFNAQSAPPQLASRESRASIGTPGLGLPWRCVPAGTRRAREHAARPVEVRHPVQRTALGSRAAMRRACGAGCAAGLRSTGSAAREAPWESRESRVGRNRSILN